MINKAIDFALGEKVANSETRHRPKWFPRDLDKRWFGERLALLTIPPYKPAYRRHVRLKAWVCTKYLHRVAILEADLDKREIDLEVYK